MFLSMDRGSMTATTITSLMSHSSLRIGGKARGRSKSGRWGKEKEEGTKGEREGGG